MPKTRAERRKKMPKALLVQMNLDAQRAFWFRAPLFEKQEFSKENRGLAGAYYRIVGRSPDSVMVAVGGPSRSVKKLLRFWMKNAIPGSFKVTGIVEEE